jgi:hypothetical protein
LSDGSGIDKLLPEMMGEHRRLRSADLDAFDRCLRNSVSGSVKKCYATLIVDTCLHTQAYEWHPSYKDRPSRWSAIDPIALICGLPPAYQAGLVW